MHIASTTQKKSQNIKTQTITAQERSHSHNTTQHPLLAYIIPSYTARCFLFRLRHGIFWHSYLLFHEVCVSSISNGEMSHKRKHNISCWSCTIVFPTPADSLTLIISAFIIMCSFCRLKHTSKRKWNRNQWRRKKEDKRNRRRSECRTRKRIMKNMKFQWEYNPRKNEEKEMISQ